MCDLNCINLLDFVYLIHAELYLCMRAPSVVELRFGAQLFCVIQVFLVGIPSSQRDREWAWVKYFLIHIHATHLYISVLLLICELLLIGE